MSLILDYYHKGFVPLFLILITIQGPLFIWNVAHRYNSSVMKFYQEKLQPQGILHGIINMMLEPKIFTSLSVQIILGFAIWNLLLMRFIPGKKVYGPITPNGNIPEYKDNGFRCYTITMLAFVALTIYLKSHGYSSPSIVYDEFPNILITLIIFGLLFCLFLCIKGLYFPSSKDCGTSHNVIFDYYWGTELYPRVGEIDIKVFTNCRFGLTAWAILISCFAIKNYELYGFQGSMFVTTVLQLLYLTKFYWWEAGYYCTIDIMLDRAGYYICYGCLVIVPSFYTSVSLCLVTQADNNSLMYNSTVFIIGLLALIINYWADYQKQIVRKTDGNCTIWGSKAKIIRAKYQLANGQNRESILLLNGFWGISRHFHYLPELLLAFCWSSTSGFSKFMPFGYFICLVILLVHRSFRDERKCSEKYGIYWEKYKKAVPYKMIPFIF